MPTSAGLPARGRLLHDADYWQALSDDDRQVAEELESKRLRRISSFKEISRKTFGDFRFSQEERKKEEERKKSARRESDKVVLSPVAKPRLSKLRRQAYGVVVQDVLERKASSGEVVGGLKGDGVTSSRCGDLQGWRSADVCGRRSADVFELINSRSAVRFVRNTSENFREKQRQQTDTVDRK